MPKVMFTQMDKYPASYSTTFKVAHHHNSNGISHPQAMPVVAEKLPIPYLLASKHSICDGSLNITRFILMPSHTMFKNCFQSARSFNWEGIHVMDQ
jgi:hypothetical protein